MVFETAHVISYGYVVMVVWIGYHGVELTGVDNDCSERQWYVVCVLRGLRESV